MFGLKTFLVFVVLLASLVSLIAIAVGCCVFCFYLVVDFLPMNHDMLWSLNRQPAFFASDRHHRYCDVVADADDFVFLP